MTSTFINGSNNFRMKNLKVNKARRYMSDKLMLALLLSQLRLMEK